MDKVIISSLYIAIETNDVDLYRAIRAANIKHVSSAIRNPCDSSGKIRDVIAMIGAIGSVAQFTTWLIDYIKSKKNKKITFKMDGINVVKNLDQIEIIIKKKVEKHTKEKK